MSIHEHRRTEHEIDTLFVSRWSTRAFSGEEITDAELFSVLEAARWAPSGGNVQPWRFIYAKRHSPAWPAFLGFLNEGNRRWADKAAALILLTSRTTRDRGDGSGQQPLRSHSFDAGAAWSNLAHQARLQGLSTRAIGGFDQDSARREVGVPPDHALEIVIALGRPDANKSGLPDDLREKDVPNDRLPLAALVAADRFSFA
ncbi:nitroreductase family protein [Thauera linaloolentis]|uniref:Nitroreductase n=1 Tax=Thauera linaloolentis (strain DSM 12138 / JCM 21573 / CCUG 41526 / CIP 105981 / IAM 15112 / NBRC 102519 / 47Lol) TaxID=1123367 RepID=N6XSF9_THAL4|nr:nitroreductase family protein [Thauera linaloolentis]ENO84681.1 nitroreductase [Thauera linaloolentis 47Lol = DSM 12138]MCM8564255.1 nitroreductase family protein [Thauera linaloolentis]